MPHAMMTIIQSFAAAVLLMLGFTTDIKYAVAYRIKGSVNETQHFVPYERGTVGHAQQYTTAPTWSNQGYYAESIVLGDSVGKNRLTSCPQMVGPIDNEYFCRGKEYGYCDRRSGTCFCTDGYMGDACGECVPTHFEVGGVCYSKTLCPNDCSGFGQCNYQTGICQCYEYREGDDCSKAKCSRYHEFCTTCDEDGCIECEDGFSSHKTAEWGEQCQPCWRFDPRCRTCGEDACTSCIDLLLLSIHRSGRRPIDPPLPMDELTRELSVTVPFGSKQGDAFYDAEHYFLVDPSITPLNESAVECHQGLNNDDSIICMPYNLTSHILCGNHGTITFDSPEYAVREDSKHVRLTLRRSGGGVGEVAVSYSFYPITAGFEDVASTAYYTTNRTVVFRQGQITASFLVAINDDRVLEQNETFSVHLSNPTGGASLGNQRRTIVTIIDDDSDKSCAGNVEASLGTYSGQSNVAVAGTSFQFVLFAITCSGDASIGGDDMFKVVARKLASEESNLEIDTTHAIGGCVHSLENAYACEVNATTSGNYEIDVYLLIAGGLKGFYFTDNVLDNSKLDMIRTDAVVNFTWGTGPVTSFGRDFVSVRWEGYVRPMHTETYTFFLDVDDHARMWIDGHLLIDWWTFPPSSSMLHAEHNLTKSESHEIILEYRDILGNATARLMWSSESTPIATIPSSSLYYKEPVRDSPFEYVVLPAATDASKSQAVGEGAHTAIAGKQHSFTIVPKDAYNNFRGWPHHSLSKDERHLDVFHATAAMLDFDEGDAFFNVHVTYDASSRTFLAAYMPRKSGHYHLNITYEANDNSMHIYGSPFALNVLPGATFAQESIAFGPGLHHGIAGDAVTATILAFDANGNKRGVGSDAWEVTVKSLLANNDYEYGTTLDHGNGTYTLNVVPLVAGPNDLSIMLEGSHIRGSPFRMHVVHNSVHGSSSFVINEAEVSSMIAMRTNAFTVQAADKWGNKAINSDDEQHDTSLLVQSNEIDASATIITYRGGGKYDICLMPVLSGEMKLGIMLNGVDILGSPLSVLVHPGEFFAETSVATGVGLRRAQAGVPASFIIQSKDEGGNNKVQDEALFNVTLTLVERASIPVGLEIFGADATDEVVVTGAQSYIENGQHLIQYTCFEAGRYDLHINDLKGNSIAGSPFSVHVIPGQLSGSHSIITGQGIVKGVAGQMSQVTVFPKDFYQNFIFESHETMEIELKLQSRHQSKWEEDNNQVGEHAIKQLVKASSDGSFRLDYLTAYAGVYSLDVMTFLQGGLEASFYSSPDLAPEHLVFSSIDANVDKDFGALPFACIEDSICVSLVDMAGPYHIGAKWSGKLEADFNEVYEIMVECNDGGLVSFVIAGEYVPWQSCWPYATFSVVLPAKPVDFAFRYKNYEGDDPFVTLKWSSPSTGSFVTVPPSNLLSQHILGSTFYPHIHPGVVYAPLSNAIGDSLRQAVSGIEQEFLVECRDVHGNLLLSGDARVVSYGYNKNATIETSVLDNENGTFVVRYHAGVSGEYLLFVQVGELSSSRPSSHIKGSPFLLAVQPGTPNPKTSILSIDNSGLGVTGRSLLSQLQTRDFHWNIRNRGGDDITAYLSSVGDRTEKYRCRVDDDDSGTYLIECPPQWKEGPYLLDVAIESEPLTSGPFNVTVLPGHAVAATTSVVSGGTSITTGSNIPSVHFIGDAGMWSSFVVSAKDVFGNCLTTGGNHFVARVIDNIEAEVQVIDQGNGEYIVAYKLHEASTYKLDVRLVTGSGLIGNYYLNETSFVDGVLIKTSIDKQIDFNTWRVGEPFSHVTWTGYISFPHNGRFELELTGVEGHFTLFIGSKVVVDSNVGSSIGSFEAMEDVLYELKMEYSVDINRLVLKMYWTSAKMSRHIVPGSHYFHAAAPIHGSPFHLTIF